LEKTFIPLPVDRLVVVDLRVEEGAVVGLPKSSDVAGCLVKVRIEVPAEQIDVFDKEFLRQQIIELGAAHVRAVEVRVLRREAVRDDRHAVELSIEDSLRIFAEETKIQDAERRIAFAAALAREADSEAPR